MSEDTQGAEERKLSNAGATGAKESIREFASLSTTLSRRGMLARTLAVGIGATFAGSLLAACGGDDDDDSDDSGNDDSGGETEPTATAATDDANDDDEPTNTPEPNNPPSGQRGSIIVARGYDGDSLDPHRTSRTDQFFRNIFDPLVARNPAFELEGVVAEGWEISEDGLEYTFKIREGMKFHDGTDVTAQDVKFTWDRASDPENPSRLMGFLTVYESVEMVGTDSVKLILNAPIASFLTALTSSFWGVLPQGAVEELGESFGTQPVGSGPWKFESWIENEQLTLVPFEDYVQPRTYVDNPGGPLASELVHRTILEEATQVAAFETGEVNIISPPFHEVQFLQEDSDVQVFVHSRSGCVSYMPFPTLAWEDGILQVKPPFDDVRTRQAVAYAINVEEVINSVFEGYYGRIFAPIATGWFAYDPSIADFGYSHNPERAMELLEEAGWIDSNDDGVREKDGEDLEISFWVADYTGQSESAQIFQNQLSQVGIKANIELLESATAYATLKDNEFDLFIDQSCWNDPDFLNFLATAAYGVGKYQRPDYIEAIEQAQRVTNQDQRKELYYEASKMFLEDLPGIPLWSSTEVEAARAEIKGLKFDMDNYGIWEDVSVEPD